jgi:hypothetical protein
MQSAVISCHVSQKLKKRAIDRANEEGVSLSRYISDILAIYFKDEEKGDEECLCFPKAELKRRLKSAEDPRNCTAFDNVEDAIKYMYKVCDESNI